MRVGMFIFKFLFLGALFIIANEDLHLNDQMDRDAFMNTFYTWVDTLYQHSLQIVGYVVDSEWLPQEDARGPLEDLRGIG